MLYAVYCVDKPNGLDLRMQLRPAHLEYLKGFTVEKVLPFAGGRGTAYSVELKGPNDEVRVLHVNPFGAVMPFGGPGRRAAR